jgi:hypothetical protein
MFDLLAEFESPTTHTFAAVTNVYKRFLLPDDLSHSLDDGWRRLYLPLRTLAALLRPVCRPVCHVARFVTRVHKGLPLLGSLQVLDIDRTHSCHIIANFVEFNRSTTKVINGSLDSVMHRGPISSSVSEPRRQRHLQWIVRGNDAGILHFAYFHDTPK